MIFIWVLEIFQLKNLEYVSSFSLSEIREPLHPDSKFPGSTCLLCIQLGHGGIQGCSAEQTTPWGRGFSCSCIGGASCASLSFRTAEAA